MFPPAQGPAGWRPGMKDTGGVGVSNTAQPDGLLWVPISRSGTQLKSSFVGCAAQRWGGRAGAGQVALGETGGHVHSPSSLVKPTIVVSCVEEGEAQRTGCVVLGYSSFSPPFFFFPQQTRPAM